MKIMNYCRISLPVVGDGANMRSVWRNNEYLPDCLRFVIPKIEQRSTEYLFRLLEYAENAQPVDDGQQIWNTFLSLAGKNSSNLIHKMSFDQILCVGKQAKVSTSTGCAGSRHKALTKHS